MKKNAPVKKNDIVTVEFEDLTHDGSGVAKVDGYPLFVPFALPGEKAKVRVIKVNKGYGFGRLEEILEQSPDRVDYPCSLHKECGGAQLLHLSYEGQLRAKEKQVRDALERIGGLKGVKVHPVMGMENPWQYRNKVQVPVGFQNGRTVAGYYKKRSHEIVDMTNCGVELSMDDSIVLKIRDILVDNGITPYDEKEHKGTIRHIVVRWAKATGEIMVVLVTRTRTLPNQEELVKDIVKAIPNVKSIVHNINVKRTNVILGDRSLTLWGKSTITDMIGEIKFAISPRSFYQVNPVQTKVLYDQALQYAQLTGEETVIDAYCGIGTISLFLAQQAKKVYGVEIVEDAVRDARENAKLNNITNAEFVAGPAETVMLDWQNEGIKADVIVVDPPRKGCEESLLNTILAMKPKRVVYVSCNPGTLARDLRILEDGGYKTVEVQPVDMFPQTTHIESVACLELE
ncbi:23S rRNA (uracil(1939)-C(5))-methyltransferase RlmD [Bacillus massiliigorillae]|uniref:23S rRNA (uracil(1939)-C(5))-methyltransferase RlmD n=1 Tax=Bacillus massiliigorillae TaxID=1243664 RepID=UPI0003A86155|nr:23S rRNA (uracil(1939)-C(5))-methyltransferase RlmD [Bacillus massiliigorillae]